MRRIRLGCGLLAGAASLLLASPGLRAQQGSGGSASPVAPSPAVRAELQTVTAPLEDRIAAARSVRVMTSVLGIELGSELDEAHEKLDQLCTPGTRPKEEGEDKGDKDARGKERETGEKLENAGVEHVGREPRNKAGEEEEEGHKVLWQLAGTDFSAIYITADDKEHIDSITAFFRPDKQLSYDAVGEVAKAPIKDDKTVLWDVLRVGSPLFRVVAKGANGKVSSIRLFVVKRGSGESARYLGAGVRKSP